MGNALTVDSEEYWAQVFAEERRLVSLGLVFDEQYLSTDSKGNLKDLTHKAHVFITSVPNAKLERMQQHAPGRTIPWELRVAAMALCDDPPLHRVSTPEEIALYKIDGEKRSALVNAAEQERKGQASNSQISTAVEAATKEMPKHIAIAVEAAMKAVLANRDESVKPRKRKEVENLEELEKEEVAA